MSDTTRLVSPATAHALATAVCAAMGSEALEARLVADHLVAANLAGHDSHGVGMIPTYVDSWARDFLRLNAHAATVTDAGSVLVLDGGHGFGQVMAFEAMTQGIERARHHGVALVGLRDSHHVGRIGHWAQQCADAGLVSIHFVNVGGAAFVAPFGGSDARFGTNPFCIGFPRSDAPDVVLDFATSAIAYGKARVAHNAGTNVPEASLLDAKGAPTNDPGVLFSDPHGCLRAMGLHKGSGLAILCELLGAALTGGRTTREETLLAPPFIVNSMASIIIDPNALGTLDAHAADDFLTWVQASPPPDDDALALPGDVERARRAERIRGGLPLDETTWCEIADAARRAGVAGEDSALLAWQEAQRASDA